MTAKDYRLLANVIRKSIRHRPCGDDRISEVVLDFDIFLATLTMCLQMDNPKFNEQKFLTAATGAK